MVKKIAFMAALAVLAACSTPKSGAFDLKSLIPGDGSSSSSTTTTGSSTTTTGSGLADALSSFLGGVFAKSDLQVSDLAGDWKYSAPAVTFKSDNLLQKAGGAAVATQVESKLQPYYAAAGLDGLTLSIAADGSFTMKVKNIPLRGTVSKVTDSSSQANFVFKFAIGKMDAYVTKTGSTTMAVMFDVSKLVTLVKAVGSLSGSSTVQAISTLLESYDGICAGYKLTRQ